MDAPREIKKSPSEWVVSIREKLKEAQQYAASRPWEKWCIYRVPQRLRYVHKDRKAYEPQTLSIGPYHLGTEHVQDIHRYKWVILHQILERTGQDISIYLDSIKAVEEQARACYQQDVNLSIDRFVEMMVLDGCFILELFRCYPRAGGKGANPVFSNRRIVDDILLDMVMLENQIPLFIIDRLLSIMRTAGVPGEHPEVRAMDLALNFFNPEWLTGKPMSVKELNELKHSLEQEDCVHILDVFRRSLLYAESQQAILYRYGFRTASGQVIHRVTELREGGVKFRKRNTNCFWDIKFKDGVFEIPTIWIQDSTMTIFLNLAAFEQCHLNISDSVIASYVVFMECLIKYPEDVSHLHHRGIIQHVLGHDAEVVDMFKSISKEMLVDVSGGYYAKLSEQVNAYYNRRRNRWRASLLHKYFYNPWAIISLVAAIILLSLTAIQSVYAVYSYYRPKS